MINLKNNIVKYFLLTWGAISSAIGLGLIISIFRYGSIDDINFENITMIFSYIFSSLVFLFDKLRRCYLVIFLSIFFVYFIFRQNYDPEFLDVNLIFLLMLAFFGKKL